MFSSELVQQRYKMFSSELYFKLCVSITKQLEKLKQNTLSIILNKGTINYKKIINLISHLRPLHYIKLIKFYEKSTIK